MVKNSEELMLKRIKVLHGDIKEEALAKGYSENDLVIVKYLKHRSNTKILEITKVVGDPLQFLVNWARGDQTKFY